jgi:hypothetical protein
MGVCDQPLGRRRVVAITGFRPIDVDIAPAGEVPCLIWLVKSVILNHGISSIRLPKNTPLALAL